MTWSVATPEVRRAALEHLRDRVQHARDGAEAGIVAARPRRMP